MKGTEPSHFDYIRKVEKEIVQEAEEKLYREITLYQESLNLLVDILDNLYPDSGKKELSFVDFVLLPILSKTVMSLKSYFDLVIKGYYNEAIVINRNILESALLCMLITKKEEYAEKWFAGKLRSLEVRKALGLKGENDLQEIYSMMSDYVHTNVGSLGSIIKFEIEKKRMVVRWAPDFDEELSRYMLFPTISFLLISHMSDLFRDRFDRKVLDEMAKYKKNIMKAFEEVQSEILSAL